MPGRISSTPMTVTPSNLSPLEKRHQNKTINFCMKIISRHVDKAIGAFADKQIKALSAEIEEIQFRMENLSTASPQYVSLQHKLEILEAKQILIVELADMHKEISDLIGEERSATIALVAKLFADEKTWTAIDIIVYKVLANQNPLKNIFGKVLYAIGKFIIKLIVIEGKKENYKISESELVEIQKIFGKHADKIADKGFITFIEHEINDSCTLSDDKKQLMCRLVRSVFSHLEGLFITPEGDAPNALLVIVAEVLRHTNLQDIGTLVGNRLPNMGVQLLAKDLVKEKFDLSMLEQDDIKPLVDHVFDFSAQMIDVLLVHNPHYYEATTSVDKMHGMIEALKEDMGEEVLDFIQAQLAADKSAGVFKQMFMQYMAGVGVGSAQESIDFTLQTISSFFQHVKFDQIESYLEATLRNPESMQKFANFIAIALRKKVAKTVFKSLAPALNLLPADEQKFKKALYAAVVKLDVRDPDPAVTLSHIKEILGIINKEQGLDIDLDTLNEDVILSMLNSTIKCTTFEMSLNTF